MRIEIGAGKKGAEGYLHVDSVEKEGVDVVDDGRILEKFDDDSVEEIYSHWFFEHVAHHEIPTMLDRWMRVLKPGGMIHLVTNNQAAHNRCLQLGEITWIEWTDLTYGVAGKSHYEVWDLHKSGWKPSLLQATLEENGYVNVDIEAQWRCREHDGRIKCPALVAKGYKPGVAAGLESQPVAEVEDKPPPPEPEEEPAAEPEEQPAAEPEEQPAAEPEEQPAAEPQKEEAAATRETD